jgi:hypothetical protein
MQLRSANHRFRFWLTGFKVRVMLRPILSCLVYVTNASLGPKTGFLLLSDWFVVVDCCLRWGDSFVICSCCGTLDHMLHSQIRDSLKLEGQVPIFTFPRNKVAQLYPKRSLSLSPTTRRVTVEVFEPACTQTLTALSKPELCYHRRSVGQSLLVSGSHLKPMVRFFFPVWQLLVSRREAPSLTRGWVCNLLPGHARAVTLGSKSLKTHDHILLSHLRLPQPGRPGIRIYALQK